MMRTVDALSDDFGRNRGADRVHVGLLNAEEALELFLRRPEEDAVLGFDDDAVPPYDRKDGPLLLLAQSCTTEGPTITKPDLPELEEPSSWFGKGRKRPRS